MEMINVLVTMPFPEALMDKLSSVSPRLAVAQTTGTDDLAEAFSTAEVLYTAQVFPAPHEAPRLKWVQLHTAGVDRLLGHELFTSSDVVLTTASGIHTVSMAEYAMAQILAFAHHIPRMFEDKAAARWPKGRRERYVPSELRGATLGIIGYGSIGREIARQAHAFGMKVLAIKRNLRVLTDEAYLIPGTGDPRAEIPERIYPAAALNSFLGECDYVVLTVPLTDETHHLVDGVALAHMKSSAVLINISRGEVVDQDALVEALAHGIIGGAALDVFREEPLPADDPLWHMPNVIISPHISGFTPHYDEHATDLFAENLRRYVLGEPLLNVVDRARGY